jgi:NTP pyrophosphatase (non-canonical NTP hydrolase)
MEVNELQKKCADLYSTFKPNRNSVFPRFVNLIEEIGEVAEAILISQNLKLTKSTDLGGEMADVFMNLMSLAEILELNIEQEVLKKMKNS